METDAVDLLGLQPEDLVARCAEAGFSAPRAINLFRSLHANPGTPVLDLPRVHRPLRQHAAASWTLAELRPGDHAIQLEDGETRKLLFHTQDGLPVETVVMPRRNEGWTVCVSSQVGCRVGCTFCRTGLMGLSRNLAAGEIVDQVRWARSLVPGEVRNVVFMGMGEPLENLPAVQAAIRLLQAPQAYAISRQRTTISTSGHVPGLRALAAEGPRVHLAISLNATTDALRDEIMPINRRYPLADLMDAVASFPLERGGTVMIEYVLLAGVNDRDEDAARLRALLEGLPVKVNLIRYNPVPGLPYERPSLERARAFREQLSGVGKGVLLRYSWGGGIAAACGQLGAEVGPRPGRADPPVAPQAPLAWTALDV